MHYFSVARVRPWISKGHSAVGGVCQTGQVNHLYILLFHDSPLIITLINYSTSRLDLLFCSMLTLYKLCYVYLKKLLQVNLYGLIVFYHRLTIIMEVINDSL